MATIYTCIMSFMCLLNRMRYNISFSWIQRDMRATLLTWVPKINPQGEATSDSNNISSNPHPHFPSHLLCPPCTSSLLCLDEVLFLQCQYKDDFHSPSLSIPGHCPEICAHSLLHLSPVGNEDGWIVKDWIQLSTLELYSCIMKLLNVCVAGKIVGVIISNNDPSSESGMLLDMTHGLRISRLLEESGSTNSTDSEVLLVRRSLAWITGIILLVSTLIGVRILYLLPITKQKYITRTNIFHAGNYLP